MPFLVFCGVNLSIYFCVKLTQKFMIDTNQLTSLISAFRVETEKESISPESVGKLLQDITNLLAGASSDTERQVLDDWKALLSQYSVVYDISHATGMSDMQTMFLTLRLRKLSNGQTLTASVPLSAATDLKAGVMTAQHVQAIMSLQATQSQANGNISALQTTVGQHTNQLFIIQSAGYVVTGISQGNGHSSKINLAVTKHDVRTGEDFVFGAGCTINGATAQQAGAMTAAHVQSLTNAKTDITTLQSQMRNVRSAGAVVSGAQVFLIDSNRVGIQLFGYDLATGEHDIELQELYLAAASQYGAGVMTSQHVQQLNALRQAVFNSDGYTVQKTYYPLAIEINLGKDALRLRGAQYLKEKGFMPYLFRYTRKRNRIIDINGNRLHGEIRKGWNVLGDGTTVQIGPLGEVKIRKDAVKHPNIDLEDIDDYQTEPKFFVSEKVDEATGRPYVPFGKSRIDLVLKQQNGTLKPRKVSLLYGIAFASYKTGKRERLDIGKLVTPIIPFHVSTDLSTGNRRWIFER